MCESTARDSAQNIVQEFSQYIADHQNDITALQILYSQPYRRRELTYQMLEELRAALLRDRPRLAPATVWDAYERLEKVGGSRPASELAALVSLVRRVLDIDQQLTPYDATVNRNFQTWVMNRHKGNAPKFTEDQMAWLRIIKDHIAVSVHMSRDDFDFSPFAEQGGLGKAWKMFGDGLDGIIEEMNERLAA